jgi:glycosyltransferase involved in cell wall biosynthesis
MKPKTIHYHSGAAVPSQSAQSVHVMKMCEAWGKASHDVTLYIKRGSECIDIYQYYGVSDVFKIVQSPNIKIPYLSGFIRIVCNWFVSLNTKPDLIYGRDPVSLLLQKWRKIPIVLELHQMPKPRVLRYFDKLVVISNALKNDIQGDNDVFVYHDCASITQNTNVKKIQKAAYNIGYAGSLHPGKGGEMLVNLANNCADYTFHILGGEPEQITTLKKQCRHKNITFYGHVSHGNIQGYLKQCDVLLAPYARAITIKSGADITRWTSPLKIFEYMAAQKPMIVSDLPVIQEILTHQYNALLVEPDNVDAWKNGLAQICKNKQLGHQIASQAYKDFLAKYTWGKRAEAILNFAMTK